MRVLPCLLTAFLSASCFASGTLSDRDMAQAQALQHAALSDNLAWDLVEAAAQKSIRAPAIHVKALPGRPP